MNNAQRTLAVLRYQNYDRLPIVHFGYWDETLEKWVQEGHLPRDEKGEFNTGVAWVAASQKLGFDFEWEPTYRPNSFLSPGFEKKTIATFPDGSRHEQNADGVTIYQAADAGSIPAEIAHLLVDRASWEEHYKPRLQWHERRVSETIEFTPPPGAPVGLHCGSLIGNLRNLMGVVGLSYVVVDDEELLDEMLQTIAELSLQSIKAALASGRHFDYGHFWEDICFKTGPLVNPELFHEKVGPHYKRITDELNRHGIDIVSVDCDGLIDSLIPTWLANGVNTMFPIEVGTWDANIKPWREQYGRALRGVGGMNKNVFALDRAAIDLEIERLRSLVALGGYIPCPDHRIPPTAHWDLVRYYCDQMRAIFG